MTSKMTAQTFYFIFILETVVETLVASVKPGTSFETLFLEYSYAYLG